MLARRRRRRRRRWMLWSWRVWGYGGDEGGRFSTLQLPPPPFLLGRMAALARRGTNSRAGNCQLPLPPLPLPPLPLPPLPPPPPPPQRT